MVSWGRFLVLCLTGCNVLLGLEDPTPIAPGAPSCATGWSHRADLTVHNGGRDLEDFQLPVRIDTKQLLGHGLLQEDGRDLRFVDDEGRVLPWELEGDLDTRSTLVWVRAAAIPRGETHVEMLAGNPEASLIEEPVFITAIDNASFELHGGWIAKPSGQPASVILFPHPHWSSHGMMGLVIDEEVGRGAHGWSESSVHQEVSFPTGGMYRIRFDLVVEAMSNRGVNGADNGALSLRLGSSSSIWKLSGDAGIVTGTYFGLETEPFGGGAVPLTFAASVAQGDEPGYAKGVLDHLRVRRYAMAEPTTEVSATSSCR